ncbi:hypothetical protein EDB89DRAFT_1906385 [Lactarius sanguifluus]|nr:hypothetical protein EDB89DRAFT_1906385 [Lactarius sanguifluus]
MAAGEGVGVMSCQWCAGVMLGWHGWGGMGWGLGHDVGDDEQENKTKKNLLNKVDEVGSRVPSWWVLHVVMAWHRGGAFTRRGTDGGRGCEDEAMREKKKEKKESKHQSEAKLIVISWGLACCDGMVSGWCFHAVGYWWWWRLWRRGHEVAAVVTVMWSVRSNTGKKKKKKKNLSTRPKHGSGGYGLMWDEVTAVTWLCDMGIVGDEMREVAPLEKYSKG